MTLPASLTHNPFFSGGAILMAFGGLMAYLRALPSQFVRRVIDLVSVDLEVGGQDIAFGWLLAWLNQQPYTQRSRRLTIDTSLDGTTVVFTPATGQHFFRYKGVPVWVNRGSQGKAPGQTAEAAGSDKGFLRKNESLHIRVLGRDQRVVRKLIEESRDLFNNMLGEKIQLFRVAWDYWSCVGPLRPRALSSVVLPTGVIDAVLGDIQTFLAKEDWYVQRGIPYRRGYLLHGKPGTGKSSLVASLAYELKLPLYTLNLGSLFGDDKLQNLFSSLPQRCIVLLEDIDATGVDSEARETPKNKRKKEPDKTSVSLSSLLNVLDGVGAAEGRVLFMTTNHRERLDSALIRPGRVDFEVEFGNATQDQIATLFERFYDAPMPAAPHVAGRYTMAELQGVFLRHAENPLTALEVLNKPA